MQGLGFSALGSAASLGALEAVEEPGSTGTGKPSGSLRSPPQRHVCAGWRPGGAGPGTHCPKSRRGLPVQSPGGDLKPLGRMLYLVKSLQHRLGQVTALTTNIYHDHGSTPLMHALRTAQYQGAAALIAAGANLELRNCRNFAAADFAKGASIPRFLQLGLEGDRGECQRVCSLALAAVDPMIREAL